MLFVDAIQDEFAKPANFVLGYRRPSLRDWEALKSPPQSALSANSV